ncbi:SpoIIE family protein phosphatase [Streptomyces radicis]|nr:SpoIIE family protein phosphatase [Streptomyces radicis]
MAAPDPPDREAADAAAPAVAVTDADGVVTAWSPGAERLLGHRAADVMGRSVATLLLADPGGDLGGDLARVLRARAGWTGFAEVRHREGHAVPLRVRVSPLSAEGGEARWLFSAGALIPAHGGEGVADEALTVLLHRSPMAVGVWDTELRLLWMNDAAARATERSLRDQVGRPVTEMPEGFDSPGLVTTMRRVLDHGAPVIDHEYPWRSADGRRSRTLSVSFFRLEAEDGRPMAVCTVAVDVSRSWARERIRLLGEASTRIGSSLDVMRTAQELAELSVPVIADYVAVDLAEAVPVRDEPLGRLDATEVSVPAFRRAGAASIHEGIPESLWARGEAVYVPSASPFTEVLSLGRSHFEPRIDVVPGTWWDADPRRARVARETGMHSLMITPLVARGETLGIAVFVRTENPRPFDKDDLVLAEELVLRAALGLDNARQYTREHATALALQRNLLPHDLGGAPAIEVATRYLPAHLRDGVGGDWFDVFGLDDDRIALVVGDVVGHGLNAAATMGQLRTAIRTLAYVGLPPGKLLGRLDALALRLVEGDSGSGHPQPLNATCVFAVYDPATRRCTMARAGHPPPALLAPDGGVTLLDLPAGTPIGVGMGAFDFESLEVVLDEGAVLALYTDGLVETRDIDIDTGLDRLRGALDRTGQPLDELCDGVIDTMVGDRLTEDDIALLLARVRPSD